MRENSAVYRLSFILPDNLYQVVPRGRHLPCLHGCLLTVHGAGLVSIEGTPREAVFDQAQRFFRVHGRGHGRGLAVRAHLIVLSTDPPPPEHWMLGAGRARQVEASAPMLPGFSNVA